jgi:hypothetical protein
VSALRGLPDRKLDRLKTCPIRRPNPTESSSTIPKQQLSAEKLVAERSELDALPPLPPTRLLVQTVEAVHEEGRQSPSQLLSFRAFGEVDEPNVGNMVGNAVATIRVDERDHSVAEFLASQHARLHFCPSRCGEIDFPRDLRDGPRHVAVTITVLAVAWEPYVLL